MPTDASEIREHVPLGRVWEYANDEAEALISEINRRFRDARLAVYGRRPQGIERELIRNPIDYRIDWLGAASLRGDYCSPRAVGLDDLSTSADQWPKNLRRALTDRTEFEDLAILRGDWDRIVGDLGIGAGAQTGSSIGAEYRAAQRLGEIFQGDPECRLTKAECRTRLLEAEPLGERAFVRIWDRATAEAPDRRRPGPRRNRITTPH